MNRGKVRININSKTMLDWKFSWPQTYGAKEEDVLLLLNVAITWQFIDNLPSKKRLTTWSLDQIKLLSKSWTKIPANFMHNPKVKHFSCQLLSALIDYIWFNGLNINDFREFRGVFTRAARDIEASTLAGFLKLAYCADTVKTGLILEENIGRKSATAYFSCHVIIVYRHSASRDDISNYFAISSQIKQKVSI